MTRTAPHAHAKAARRVVSPDEEWAANIRAKIRSDAHPWQLEAIDDPARRISLRVGRGGAKTTTMRARALIKITTLKNQRLGYAATSADQARDLNWDKIKSSCEAYDIRSTPGAAWSTGSGKKTKGADPDVSFLDTKMVMTCHRTGSVYRLRGVEDKRDAEKFRGFPQAEFDIDEAGSFPPELLEYLIDQCVAPRLGEAMALDGGRGGCLLLGSTPPSQLRGIFYEVTRHGSARHRPYSQRDSEEYAKWKGFSSHAWTLKDVYDLPNAIDLYPALVANWEQALIEKEEKGWSDDNPIWMREYLGEWSADNTTMVFTYRPFADVDGESVPWNQWNPHGEQFIEGIEGLKKAIAALPKLNGKPMSWLYAYAADTGGTRDPFAINVFAFSPQDPTREIRHVFGFERMGMYARPIAQLMLGADESAPTGCYPLDRPQGLLGVTGWPVGSVVDSDQNLIDELANVYGLRFSKAIKVAEYKFGAVELVNGDLVDGRFKVLKGSPLEKQMQTLQWKPDDFGNNREDKAQANHCFVAGTMVMTERGERPIETVRRGEFVWTRAGLRVVTFSGQTGERPTMRATLSSGRDLIATADHKVWTQDGWMQLELLTPSDTLVEWESTDQAKLLSSTARSTDGIRTGRTSPWPATSPHPTASSFIGRSGSICAAQSLRGITSTTRTATTPTTESRTSSPSTDANTSAPTAEARSEQPSRRIASFGTQFLPLGPGTLRQRAWHGILETLSRRWLPAPCSPSRVSSAGLPFRPSSLTPSCAAGSAAPSSAAIPASTTSSSPVNDAASCSSATATPGIRASVRTLAVEPTGRIEPVYDLTVEGEHEFFANGVLVHNSSDCAIYGRRLIAHLFEIGSVSTDTPRKSEAYKDPQGLDEVEPVRDDDLLSGGQWGDVWE